MRKVEIYDTTLRDGAQTEGISFSVTDKIRIIDKLVEAGIHYIEGGWPGANPKDVELFKRLKKKKIKKSKISAFGSTRYASTNVKKDKVMKGLLDSGAKYITLFGKTWDLHVKDVLRTSLPENLSMIEDSIAYLKSKNKFVIFDAEHFFDGYKNNSQYAIRALLAAEKAGADRIVLCDTNGGTITSQVFEIVKDVKNNLYVPIGMHAHNDNEMAVANTIAAVQAGASHVQGTINGYGERCGNANLISIIANLKLKLDIDCISDLAMKELTEVSKYVAEISNMKHNDHQPFVGQSAFAHKAGVHVNAILKTPASYEHIDPEKIGNKRKILISELSGKSTIAQKAESMKIKLDKSKAHTQKILKKLQDMEHEGYQFEAAEASLELLMKRALSKFKDFFKLIDFRVTIERSKDAKLSSKAMVKVKVGNRIERAVSLGDGPVNALDGALRKALNDFYPMLKQMHLADFKVRVLDEKSGTAAKVRVLIQSQDKTESWWTVGVSENIIEASWFALADSIEYKLLKDKKTKHRSSGE